MSKQKPKLRLEILNWQLLGETITVVISHDRFLKNGITQFSLAEVRTQCRELEVRQIKWLHSTLNSKRVGNSWADAGIIFYAHDPAFKRGLETMTHEIAHLVEHMLSNPHRTTEAGAMLLMPLLKPWVASQFQSLFKPPQG